MNTIVNTDLNMLLETMQQLWQAVPVKLDYELVQIVFPLAARLMQAPHGLEQMLPTNVMTASLQVGGYIAAGTEGRLTLINLNVDYFTGKHLPQELITETDIIHQAGNLVRCQCHLYGESNRLLGRGMSVFAVEKNSV